MPQSKKRNWKDNFGGEGEILRNHVSDKVCASRTIKEKRPNFKIAKDLNRSPKMDNQYKC